MAALSAIADDVSTPGFGESLGPWVLGRIIC